MLFNFFITFVYFKFSSIDYEDSKPIKMITDDYLAVLFNIQAWTSLLPVYMENTVLALQKIGECT